MEEKQEKFKYHELRVSSVWGADSHIKRHVSKVILGTPGKMRYRHKGALEKMEKVGETLFLTLSKGERLLGTVGFVHRLVRATGKTYNAFMVRYFAISSPMRARKHKVKRKRAEDDKGFVLKEMIKAESNRMPEYLSREEHTRHKTLSYAYIEKENQRSFDQSEIMGYRTLGEVRTQLFSRFSPRKCKRVRSIREEERLEMYERLDKFYEGHNMYFKDYLPLDKDYFVLEEEGEIVAGLQAYRASWEIVEMPGFSGWMLTHIFPYVPYLRRLFNAGDLNYVSFEGVWYKDGYEKKISKLYETVCAEKGVSLGILWHDSRSRYLARIGEVTRLGIIARMEGDSVVLIRFKGFGLTGEEVEEFNTRPVYISAYDMT